MQPGRGRGEGLGSPKQGRTPPPTPASAGQARASPQHQGAGRSCRSHPVPGCVPPRRRRVPGRSGVLTHSRSDHPPGNTARQMRLPVTEWHRGRRASGPNTDVCRAAVRRDAQKRGQENGPTGENNTPPLPSESSSLVCPVCSARRHRGAPTTRRASRGPRPGHREGPTQGTLPELPPSLRPQASSRPQPSDRPRAGASTPQVWGTPLVGQPLHGQPPSVSWVSSDRTSNR